MKIYQADQQKADEMDVESRTSRRITMKVLTMQLNSTSVMDIVAYGGAAIGMAVAVSEFKRKYRGRNVMYHSACQRVFLPLRLLGSFFHIAMNGMAASDKIFDFRFAGTTGWRKNTAGGHLDVTLKDVHFSYEETEILKGINLNLPAGSLYHWLVSPDVVRVRLPESLQQRTGDITEKSPSVAYRNRSE